MILTLEISRIYSKGVTKIGLVRGPLVREIRNLEEIRSDINAHPLLKEYTFTTLQNYGKCYL